MTAPAPAILFVGAVVAEDACNRSPACNAAGNRFQLDVVAGLREVFDVTPEVLTLEPMPALPRSRRLRSRRRVVTLGPGIDGRALAFLNLPVIKQLSIALDTWLQVRAWLRRTEGAPRRLLLVFNLFPPLALALLAATRRHAVTTIAMVCDFPHNQSHDVAGLRGLPQRIDLWLEKRALRRFAGLVAVTPAVGEDFAPRLPLLVLEGGASRVPEAETGDNGPEPGAARILLVAGTLNEVNGIELLLQAFARVEDPRLQLWIFGRGPLEARVRAAASADSRIRYRGFIPQREVRALLPRATALLNLRLSWPVTRYTFPSKLLEYMASGRPVISTAFAGIPDEYRQRLLVLQEESPAALADLIVAMLARPAAELEALGSEARRFVLVEKSWPQQAERLGAFVRKLWQTDAG